MANFKVGDRVRVVGQFPGTKPRLIGLEGVIVNHDPNDILDRHWDVRLPVSEKVGTLPPDVWCFASHHLAPLTDPSADRFIESIKRLGREPINDAPKVTVTK